MMLANDLKTYYDEVRRYLDCPKDEQDRLLLRVNKQVIELQVDNPNLDYDGIVDFLGEPESLACSLMDDIDPEIIKRHRLRKKRIRIGSLLLSIVIIITLVVFSGYSFFEKENNFYLIKKEVTIINGEN